MFEDDLIFISLKWWFLALKLLVLGNHRTVCYWATMHTLGCILLFPWKYKLEKAGHLFVLN